MTPTTMILAALVIALGVAAASYWLMTHGEAKWRARRQAAAHSRKLRGGGQTIRQREELSRATATEKLMRKGAW